MTVHAFTHAFPAPSRPGRPCTKAALQRARHRHRKYTIAYTGTNLTGYTIHRVIPRALSEPGTDHLLTQLIDAEHDWTTVRALSPDHALRLATTELAEQADEARETTGAADVPRDQGADPDTALHASAVTVALLDQHPTPSHTAAAAPASSHHTRTDHGHRMGSPTPERRTTPTRTGTPRNGRMDLR
ncbi:hypothetical protein ACFVYG_32435 [Streptomyces sp. NPDC058256]|uniref:hypothetical protein n=1 Tax=Streptomyces sp. NPDC058256 TaxID=3346408 RepID=UPI0036E2FB3E